MELKNGLDKRAQNPTAHSSATCCLGHFLCQCPTFHLTLFFTASSNNLFPKDSAKISYRWTVLTTLESSEDAASMSSLHITAVGAFINYLCCVLYLLLAVLTQLALFIKLHTYG